MKLKFVATAAVALMLAAPAFAVTDFDPALIATGALTEGIADTEFAGSVYTLVGNASFINQEAADSVAYINSTGANNFAAIVQSNNDGGIATIYQNGDGNKAAIIQK